VFDSETLYIVLSERTCIWGSFDSSIS